MTTRQSGTVTSFNGSTGLIASPAGDLYFRSDNRAFIGMALQAGDTVTFRVSVNTAYDGGMDLAVSILVDGYEIPQRTISAELAEMRRKADAQRARVALAVKRRRNSAEAGWLRW